MILDVAWRTATNENSIKRHLHPQAGADIAAIGRVTGVIDGQQPGVRSVQDARATTRPDSGAICFHAFRFSESWDHWQPYGGLRVSDAGKVTCNPGICGIGSMPIPMPGRGLYQLRGSWRPGNRHEVWTLTVINPADGRPVRPPVQIAGEAETFELTFYLPGQANAVVINLATVATNENSAHEFEYIRLFRLDESVWQRTVSGRTGLPVIASLSSHVSRAALLADAIGSLLPQCDTVQVFLGGYPRVPDFLIHPRVEFWRSQDYGPLGDLGKLGIARNERPNERPPGYSLICRDNLVYPLDLVETLSGAMKRAGGDAILGLQGGVFPPPGSNKPFLEIHADHALDVDQAVDVLGACIFARSENLPPSPAMFQFSGMADRWLAAHARANNIPLIAIRRPDQWVRRNADSDPSQPLFDMAYPGSKAWPVQAGVLSSCGYTPTPSRNWKGWLSSLGIPFLSARSRTPPDSASRLGEFFQRVVVLADDSQPDNFPVIRDQLAGFGIEPLRHRGYAGAWPEIRSQFASYFTGASLQEMDALPPLADSRDFFLSYKTEAQRIACIEQLTGAKAITTPDAWAQLLSIGDIIEAAIVDQVQALLILSDSARFEPEAEPIFSRCVADLPEDWKILHLEAAATHPNRLVDRHSAYLRSVKGENTGESAIGLHSSALPYLLDRIRRMDMPLDIGALSTATIHFSGKVFATYRNVARAGRQVRSSHAVLDR